MTDKFNDNFNPINSLNLYSLNSYFLDFIKLFETNKLPKVLLLSGEKGIGKFTLCFHFINYVLSKNTKNSYNQKDQTIDKDNQIYRQILVNTCENFTYIANEDKKKSSIENIRNIKKKFNNTLLNNFPRFIVFDDVELLNINSANSLLKFIEEPSQSNYFILINNKKQNIIETIKSRSLEFKFFINNDEKKEIFKKLITHHNLKKHFTHDFIDLTTHGRLIKYAEIFKYLNIDIETSFYSATNIILDQFKKTKNPLFLDTITFFLEIKSHSNQYTNSLELINSINQKNNIMKLLYNYKTFNLTNNSVLEYIKKNKLESYVK